LFTGTAAMVVGDLAHRAESLWRGRVAFVWDGRTRTYPELADRTARLAAVLAAMDVREGTRVAILSPNHPDVIEMCLAASLLGAVVVPLNIRLRSDDLRFQIDDGGVTHASSIRRSLTWSLPAVSATSRRGRWESSSMQL